MRFEARGNASLLLPSSAEPSSSSCAAPPPRAAAGVRTLFASLGSALLGTAAAPPPVKERATGTVFGGEVDYCAGKRGCPVITGAG